MNKAEKCPVCRSDGRKERGLADGEYVAYYVCDTCMFMCGLEDLPRVAAAMELARLEVEFENCEPEDEYKYQDIIAWARDRVLEVFGK